MKKLFFLLLFLPTFAIAADVKKNITDASADKRIDIPLVLPSVCFTNPNACPQGIISQAQQLAEARIAAEKKRIEEQAQKAQQEQLKKQQEEQREAQNNQVLSELMKSIGGTGGGGSGSGSNSGGGSQGSGNSSAGAQSGKSGIGKASYNFDPTSIKPSADLGPLSSSDEEMKDFISKIDTKADCSNFGVDGKNETRTAAGHDVNMTLKKDINCICIALGGKIKSNGFDNGRGHCHGGDQHGCGDAIDIYDNSYKNSNKDALMIAMFLGMGYNVATYNSVGSIHVDRQLTQHWQSWSEQGAQKNPNYKPQMQNALKLIGFTNAQSPAKLWAAHPEARTRSAMVKKAKDYIEKVGSQQMKNCLAGDHLKI